MERTPAKRSSLFLLELMIAILFFCLASAVCVQIFVKAHTTSRGTQELNTALEKVSGYTELFLADALAEDTEVFYDADWQECSKDEASYEIVIRVEPDGKLLHGTFTVQRLSGEQPEEIYSVETDRMTGTERECRDEEKETGIVPGDSDRNAVPACDLCNPVSGDICHTLTVKCKKGSEL